MGTGLGPRAYAIIGQGTISRIIESRPEELRLFLEEAAGVSKYKERRRETQNRLHDTVENLTRVEDILRELGSNLEKLEKQAEVAAHTDALNASATLKQHQLWLLKKQDAEGDLAAIRAQGLEAVNALEEGMAQLRHIEADMESQRQAHYSAGDAVNQAQGQLYAATAEVGKLETEIRYVLEGRQRIAQRLQQLAEQTQQWQERQEAAALELEELCASGMDAQEQAELLDAQVQEQTDCLPALEEAMHRAQAQAKKQHQQVVQVQQRIQVLAAEQRQFARTKPPARKPPGALAGRAPSPGQPGTRRRSKPCKNTVRSPKRPPNWLKRPTSNCKTACPPWKKRGAAASRP